MKKLLQVALMVGIAVGVFVLIAYAVAERFPEGVRTTGIIIGDTPAGGEGEGEGEGEPQPPADTLAFQNSPGYIIFFGGDGVILAPDMGALVCGDPEAPSAFVAGAPMDFFYDGQLTGPQGDQSYVMRIDSITMNHISGETGVITAGRFDLVGREGEGEGETVSFDGVYLWGQLPGDITMTSLVHAGTTGGLTPPAGEGEGEGEPEAGPLAEMVVFSPTCVFPGQQQELAYVRLKADDFEGEVTMGNAADASLTVGRMGDVTMANATNASVGVTWLGEVNIASAGNASITATSTGNIVIQLGASEPGGLGGGGNTGSMMSAPNAMASQTTASEETPPAGRMRRVPPLGMHAAKNPFSGS